MAITLNGDGLIEVGGTSTTQGRVRLAEDTDNGTNYIELTAPASVTSNRTITMPDATTTLIGTDTTDTLTNKTLTSPTISGTPVVSGSLITAATAKSATGTSVDFDSIPSWVKRITVMFDGVSTNGTSNLQTQLGDSGGFETSGYLGGCSQGTAVVASSSGMIIATSVTAADAFYGLVIITKLTGNTWVSSGGLSNTFATRVSANSKTLSDILTQIRITTVNGTDTFDAGSINIMYE